MRKEKDLGINADGSRIPFNLEWECRERRSAFPTLTMNVDLRSKLTILNGSFDKHLMLTRLAQEIRSATPVGAVSNRTGTQY